MKAKVDKVKKTSTSKLVDIKKTKADIQKAKKPKKEVKAAAVKVAASSVAAPLTFAEKKVLSVKRKTKATKAKPETKSDVKNAPVKPKVAKVEKATIASARTVEPAVGKPSPKKNSSKKTVQGAKQAGEKHKQLLDVKASAKKGKKKGLKQEKESAAGAPSEGKKSPKAAPAEGAKKVENEKKGKEKAEKKKKIQKPREVGPVAEEVNDETLALVPKQLVTPANFKVMFEHVKKKTIQEEKNRLFGDDVKYSLFITAVKIPKIPGRNSRVTLPHATVRNDDDACLIVSDLIRGHKVDYTGTLNHWQDKLSELGISSSLQVIPLQQLKRDYRQYEMKLKLVHRFGRFLVDARIAGHVYGFLGKHFFNRKKTPIPVKLEKKEAIKDNIEKALRTETYRQTNKGKQTSIKFAAEWMPVEHAIENGMALLEQLKDVHPGGWLNIQSIHLTSACSLVTSFPLYLSVIDPNLVPVPHKVGPREAFIAKQNAKMLKTTGGKYEVTANGLLKQVKQTKDKKIKRTREPQPSDRKEESEEGKPVEEEDGVKLAKLDNDKEEVDEELDGDVSEGEEEDDDDEDFDGESFLELPSDDEE